MKLVCEECGSDQIQTLCWVRVATQEVMSGGYGEFEDNWCEACNCHTEFCSEEEFLKNKQEK